MTMPSTTSGTRFDFADLAAAKRAGRPIVMATGYDFAVASALDAAGVDIVLVGDSRRRMTVLGLPATRDVTLDEMLMLTRAVRRGVVGAMVVGDLRVRDVRAVGCAGDVCHGAPVRLTQSAAGRRGKMEGAGPTASRARAVVAGRNSSDGTRWTASAATWSLGRQRTSKGARSTTRWRCLP